MLGHSLNIYIKTRSIIIAIGYIEAIHIIKFPINYIDHIYTYTIHFVISYIN